MLNKDRNSQNEQIPVVLKDTRQKKQLKSNVAQKCGWGRVLFANTYKDINIALRDLKKEEKNQRDILFYIEDPHVALSYAPQDVFLDPSHTYRMWMNQYRPSTKAPTGYFIRRINSHEDLKQVNEILSQRKMMNVDEDYVWKNRNQRNFIYFVAEDNKTKEIIGVVMGLDHYQVYKDPTKGTSLWCLAVSAKTTHPKIGEYLTRHLIEHYNAIGRSYLDLSVMHNNEGAIKLYKKLGFKKAPIFCMKLKNVVNESLYIAPEQKENLNPYAQIVVDEARRRGISYEILDEKTGLMLLKFGGKKVYLRESLSDMTSAIGLHICDNKDLTHRILQKEGFSVPRQHLAKGDQSDINFLKEHGEVVVKPSRGEQGQGITLGITATRELRSAIKKAEKFSEKVIIEEYVSGHDVRFIVIDYQFVAAAIRKPARITGNGKSTIKELIDTYHRRRFAATGGESQVKLDAETKKILKEKGYTPEDILESGKQIFIKRTANVHTGGTIDDISKVVSAELKRTAEEAARSLHLPVVGFDFMVKDYKKNQTPYYIIEANERPGLANHEPQPTAERYIDLLFPQTKRGMKSDKH